MLLADAVVSACPKHIVTIGNSAGQSIGKHEICSVLGQGGAGIVHKVYDRATRVLALKRILDLQVSNGYGDLIEKWRK